jgi:hypothetical protein
MVVVTEHYSDRYRQRVGRAGPDSQAAWLRQTLRERRPKRQDDGTYWIKLKGSSHVAVLSRDGKIWVAITVREGGHRDGQYYGRADEEDMGHGQE